MNTPQNVRYTMHWDGGDVLFTDFGSAASVVLCVGKLGEVDSSGNLTVVDRDESGTSQSVRSRFGWTRWSAALPYLASQKQLNTKGGGSVTPGYDQGSNPVSPPPGLPGAIGMNRADGYNSGDFEFQGVRVHDDTSSQWLTPDAYAGDVSDPMSQKPFMWNGNNPVAYGDPSGFTAIVPTNDGSDGVGSGMGHTMVIITDPKTHLRARCVRGVLIPALATAETLRGTPAF